MTNREVPVGWIAIDHAADDRERLLEPYRSAVALATWLDGIARHHPRLHEEAEAIAARTPGRTIDDWIVEHERSPADADVETMMLAHAVLATVGHCDAAGAFATVVAALPAGRDAVVAVLDGFPSAPLRAHAHQLGTLDALTLALDDLRREPRACFRDPSVASVCSVFCWLCALGRATGLDGERKFDDLCARIDDGAFRTKLSRTHKNRPPERLAVALLNDASIAGARTLGRAKKEAGRVDADAPPAQKGSLGGTAVAERNRGNKPRSSRRGALKPQPNK